MHIVIIFPIGYKDTFRCTVYECYKLLHRQPNDKVFWNNNLRDSEITFRLILK